MADATPEQPLESPAVVSTAPVTENAGPMEPGWSNPPVELTIGAAGDANSSKKEPEPPADPRTLDAEPPLVYCANCKLDVQPKQPSGQCPKCNRTLPGSSLARKKRVNVARKRELLVEVDCRLQAHHHVAHLDL